MMMGDWVRRQWNAEEYSEVALALRASMFLLPAPLIMVASREPWYLAVAVWVVSSLAAYRYGWWIRDDEDGDR